MSTSEDVGLKSSPDTPTTLEPFPGKQTMLILVGLIASGKSTFAKALEEHFPHFCRCNQDDLGNRQQVEELAYRTLCEGRSPCIDRTNFNAIQRSYWTAIAREFPGISVSIIVFDTPYHVCASRLGRRTSHPTIRDVGHGMAVLQKFASDFSMPSPDEGYDHIIHLRPADHPHPEYTRDDVLSTLARLNAAPGRGAGTSDARQRNDERRFGRGGGQSRNDRARDHRGFSLDGPARFTSRVGGSNRSNWRPPSSDVTTNRERSDPRSPAAASVPAMESSKGESSAEERHNSS